jgi:hypothetical protein
VGGADRAIGGALGRCARPRLRQGRGWREVYSQVCVKGALAKYHGYPGAIAAMQRMFPGSRAILCSSSTRHRPSWCRSRRGL